ncbi:hypothetical protein C8R47DRAFT_1218895 [Mycena vitilis]|nr:hypothetical protein C8R47DRAFT_1218895 [Mycena vitilis]
MPHKLRLLRNATWTLRNLCRGHPPRPQWDPILPAMTVLTKLVYSLDDKILIDACWAISYLSDDTDNKIQETPVLRSVGNIVTGDDLQTQTRYLVAHGCIKTLCDLTMMDNKVVQVTLDGLDNILKATELPLREIPAEGDLGGAINDPAVDPTGSFAYDIDAIKTPVQYL